MADAKKTPRIRKEPTPSKMQGAKDGQKHVRKARKKVTGPIAGFFGRIARFFKLEFHPIKLPQNKMGKLLTKRRSFIPAFLSGAFYEISQTTWPTGRETVRLTGAVFIFAVIFAGIAGGLDWVLDKVFRSIILG